MRWRARKCCLNLDALRSTRPFNLLVTGVGGTGVITVGALITMAAHLEGKGASVLDFTGFAQKFGPVLSFIRLANSPDDIHQVRIDQGAADAPDRMRHRGQFFAQGVRHLRPRHEGGRQPPLRCRPATSCAIATPAWRRRRDCGTSNEWWDPDNIREP